MIAGVVLPPTLTWEEVACHCGKCSLPPHVAPALQAIAWVFVGIRAAASYTVGEDCPLVVTCGYRCPAHNLAVGGVSDSWHLEGGALDLRKPGHLELLEFHGLCRAVCPGGVGLYPERRDRRAFVHVDIGPRRDWSK